MQRNPIIIESFGTGSTGVLVDLRSTQLGLPREVREVVVWAQEDIATIEI